MINLLQQAVKLGVLRPLDVQLAKFFAKDEPPLLALAVAWLSAEVGSGHVCLPIAWLKQENLFNNRQPELAEKIWAAAGNPEAEAWKSAFTASKIVSEGLQAAPFVFHNERFYLQRMWQDEGRVAQFFQQSHTLPLQEPESIGRVLNLLFETDASDEVNWQKIAAAVAVTQRTAIISGGPGTGKTTTVAKLLAALILLSDKQDLRITLAAPTGKAAARLTESLGNAIASLPLTEEQKALIPSEAATIHRLLGAKPNSIQLYYHQDNPLHLDILVVDEASMIDLPMMARLIAALPEHARFILLGDRDQLASVEAGAVLGDICRFVEWGYSSDKLAQLSRLTDAKLDDCRQRQGPAIRDCLCLLRKSYRFDSDSGIGQLALAVNQGNAAQVLNCLNRNFSDVSWVSLSCQQDYERLIETCIEGYKNYLRAVAKGKPKEVLAGFNQFQLLCALRSGPFGVRGLNERIEQALAKNRLIRKDAGRYSAWYAGRPVMVNRNDNTLGLYNGDIGIALYDEHHELRVYFQLPDGSVRSVQINRLPGCETAFAMTVHKSQGSEFNHTVLVLPDSYSPLLTRELVYTAITRARQKLTLFSSEAILMTAVRKPTERRSGLAERLI